MIITIKNGQSFDTEKDLTAAERHILQKLFIWKDMVSSLQEFREKKEEALLRGWNNSGPIKESNALKTIIRDMAKRVSARMEKGVY